MKPRIWVDCDGVLSDFVEAYLELVADLFGRAHVHNDVTRFNFSECVTTKEEDRIVWGRINATPGLIRGLPDLPGVDYLPRLRELGDVGCLTSPTTGPHWVPERFAWLLDRGFTKRDVIFASDKSHVRGDFLIDDSLENCEAWQAAHPNGVAILLDSPWNRHQLAGDFVRAYTWEDVINEIASWA